MKHILFIIKTIILFFVLSSQIAYSQQTQLSRVPCEDKILEVFPHDHDIRLPWGPPNNASGAVSIGNGIANTIEIVRKYGDWNHGNYVARVCANLNAYGSNDWYLPSRNELMQLYHKRHQIDGLSSGLYWSSTDDAWGSEAQMVDFSSGIVLFQAKNNLANVRCVRHYKEQIQEDVSITREKEPEVIPLAQHKDNENVPKPADDNVFIDPRDGKSYKTVKIGNQVWMAENLKYEMGINTYIRAGKRDVSGRLNDTFLNHQINKKRRDGLDNELYMFYNEIAAKSSPCPKGWYVPGSKEWEDLINYIGGHAIAGKKLKHKTYGGTDDYGFSALLLGEVTLDYENRAKGGQFELHEMQYSTFVEYWTSDYSLYSLNGTSNSDGPMLHNASIKFMDDDRIRIDRGIRDLRDTYLWNPDTDNYRAIRCIKGTPASDSYLINYTQSSPSNSGSRINQSSNSAVNIGNTKYGWEIKVIRADNGLPVPNATLVVDYGTIVGMPNVYYTDGNGVAMVKADYMPGSNPTVIVERVQKGNE